MASSDILEDLFEVLHERKVSMPANSYTSDLYRAGEDKILSKIIEEAGEVLKASHQETNQRVIEESADLIYHLLVLLAYKEIEINQVFEELEKRRS